MSNAIYKKQYNLSQIISQAWYLFIENFRTIAIITLIIYVPIHLFIGSISLFDVVVDELTSILDWLFGTLVIMAIIFFCEE